MILKQCKVHEGFPCGSAGKESTCNAGDLDSIPGLGRSPEGGHGNPIKYSCLENPMDIRAWSEFPFPSPGDLPDPGIESRSPALPVVSSLTEPPGKLNNTGVGSHSLCQRIFPIQGSNWGILHCRQIPYGLSRLSH